MKNKSKARHKKHKLEKNLLAGREEWLVRGRRGFELSFTFIFSLILIAVFIYVAIWAIKHFLELKDRTLIQASIDDIKSEIQETWQAEGKQETLEFLFPKSVTYICFANLTSLTCLGKAYCSDLNNYSAYSSFKQYNTFVLPFKLKAKYGIQGAYLIKCGGIDCLTFANPTCIQNKAGKVKIKFSGVAGGLVNVSAG
ncbi:MAG: hypothetical protein QXE64_01830 [Candidatus Pacearchaeota archaeon]